MNNKNNLELLWDVCRVPDFEKIFNDNYLFFLKNIFLTLIKNNYKIPEDWINNRVSKLENFTGGIPELSLKISQIRTWTYISNHHSWLIDGVYWQEKTRLIENELSDNLHIGLTNKFIDSSSKYFSSNSKENIIKNIEINKNNEVILDGKQYGTIKGFNLQLANKDISYSLFLSPMLKK